mmetsp:Transcript_57807/g.95901  ORF Transcript_57807/g.95901 Transcript_57807/m.95901 type:complete len:251 (+) Transcript_57807:1783-2535(+)
MRPKTVVNRGKGEAVLQIALAGSQQTVGRIQRMNKVGWECRRLFQHINVFLVVRAVRGQRHGLLLGGDAHGPIAIVLRARQLQHRRDPRHAKTILGNETGAVLEPQHGQVGRRVGETNGVQRVLAHVHRQRRQQLLAFRAVHIRGQRNMPILDRRQQPPFDLAFGAILCHAVHGRHHSLLDNLASDLALQEFGKLVRFAFHVGDVVGDHFLHAAIHFAVDVATPKIVQIIVGHIDKLRHFLVAQHRSVVL